MLHARRLTYLNEIAKCGSIRRAAEKLNVASSAINRQIIALEEEIGTQIFERLPRGLRLTAAGELYIEHVRETLKNYNKLKARVSGLKTPHTGRFTMVSTVGLTSGPLPEIIAAFLESPFTWGGIGVIVGAIATAVSMKVLFIVGSYQLQSICSVGNFSRALSGFGDGSETCLFLFCWR